MIAGFILIVVAFVMLFAYLRNAKRPRMEVRIESISFEHVKQDKRQQAPKHPHAHVKYRYDGVARETMVLLKVRSKAEGDWIMVSVNPTNPDDLVMYSPEREKRVIFVLFMIGVFLVAGSWWILDYFDAW